MQHNKESNRRIGEEGVSNSMKLIKLYFETIWEILFITAIFDIILNILISRNFILFISTLLSVIFTTLTVYIAFLLYYGIRYELPHKMKIFALRLKLFWKFMKYTEDELKTFELVMNKVKEITEKRGKS